MPRNSEGVSHAAEESGVVTRPREESAKKRDMVMNFEIYDFYFLRKGKKKDRVSQRGVVPT